LCERGAIDGIVTPPNPQPFKGFFEELFAVIPPLTMIGAARRGLTPFIANVIGLLIIYAAARGLSAFTTNPGETLWLGLNKQWLFIGVGSYAIYSWATNLREKDPASFALIWSNPAFLCTIMGYGCVAFGSYATSYWAAPYAERAFAIPKTEIGWLIGGPGAMAGFLGVILGGRMADDHTVRHRLHHHVAAIDVCHAVRGANRHLQRAGRSGGHNARPCAAAHAGHGNGDILYCNHALWPCIRPVYGGAGFHRYRRTGNRHPFDIGGGSSWRGAFVLCLSACAGSRTQCRRKGQSSGRGNLIKRLISA
jgi:hypothetical protein